MSSSGRGMLPIGSVGMVSMGSFNAEAVACKMGTVELGIGVRRSVFGIRVSTPGLSEYRTPRTENRTPPSRPVTAWKDHAERGTVTRFRRQFQSGIEQL